MARTILVTVGVSLVTEKIGEKETALAGFGQLNGAFSALSTLQRGLEEADRQQKERRPFNPDARKWVDARSALVQKLQALWGRPDTELDEGVKRAWSGAELASLQLLGREQESPHALLCAEDRVVLLASDTPSGKFCAETIATALQRGLWGATPASVRVVDIEGLRASNAQLFLEKGLPNTARELAVHRSDSLLIASGGYKGLLPYLTPIAMQLRIRLLYLYEESDSLIEVLPMDLPMIVKVVKDLRGAFNRIDPTQGRDVEYGRAFWEEVDRLDPEEGREDITNSNLVVESGESVRLTPLGLLACQLQPILDPAE